MKKTMKQCNACGADMATSAKACPKCGAKNKKPIYKRVWFWAIIIVILLFIIGSIGSDSDSETPKDDSTQVEQPVQEEPVQEEPVQEEPEATLGEKNALETAYLYLDTAAFSKKGLKEQLEFEGYTSDEAQYAVDNCGISWKMQAALMAQQYLDTSSFSREGLIEQLEFEGFTHKQAVYGVEQVGY